jgi:hypothetical protein
MKRLCIGTIIFFSLCTIIYTQEPCNSPVVTSFVLRSQSFNNAIKNAAMDPYNQYLFTPESMNGALKITFEYNQSFSNYQLGLALFGSAVINGVDAWGDGVIISVVGSEAAIPANGINDLVADNFFLPTDYRSTVLLKPDMQNVNLHLQAYIGFDEWCPGLYARLYFPLSYTRAQLRAIEQPVITPAMGFDVGAISSAAVPTTSLQKSFLNYAAGVQLNPLPGGELVQPLLYSRFGGCNTDSITRIADVRAELGWNFLLQEEYHLGIYIAAAAPTGNNSTECNRFLWSATAGNGKHWELGGGLSGHCMLWQSNDTVQQFDFYTDITINHLFNNTERRTFDLKNKPLSRYIIAEQLTTAENNLLIDTIQATTQFAKQYAPIANISTLDVPVSIPVQVDIMAKFVYSCRGFNVVIGYDFWGQACPQVHAARGTQEAFPANTWALRGDAHLYGFDAAAQDMPIAIPATYNATTIFSLGTPFQSGIPADANGGVDGAATPVTFNDSLPLITTPGEGPATDIFASSIPETIAFSDLNLTNATAHGTSNSVFAEINYTWIDHEYWIPYFGFGTQVEFGGIENQFCSSILDGILTTRCTNICDSCPTCALSKWSVWIAAGVSFH